MINKIPNQYCPFFYIAIAIILKSLPIISLPLKWLESFFHEISHGLAAVVTGGRIIQIQLFPNGAGLCTTLGGSEFIILFSGYFGAVVWGLMIYYLANSLAKTAKTLIYLLIAIIGITMALWTRDVLTLTLLIILIAMLSLILKMSQGQFTKAAIQIVGLTIILNALYSPTFLIDGQSRGDGAALASITYIPEIIWVGIWLITALLALTFVLFRRKVGNGQQ